MMNFNFLKRAGYISLIRVNSTNKYTLIATHDLPVDALVALKRERTEALSLIHSIQVANVRIPEIAMYWFSGRYQSFFAGDDLFEFSDNMLPSVIESMDAHERNNRRLQFIIPALGILVVGIVLGILVVEKDKNCQNNLSNQCPHRIK
jgi:hypothetical protein